MAHYFYAVVFFLAAQVCIRWNTLLMNQMIKLVNTHRPLEDAIPASFRNRKGTTLIEAEYERYYPDGRLPRWRTISLALGLVSYLLTAVMFFKPGH